MRERRGRSRSDAADTESADGSGAPEEQAMETEGHHDAGSLSYKPLYKRVPTSCFPPTNDHILTRGLLIAQFASPDGKSLADAVELICGIKDQDNTGADGEGGGRLIDGVDLNCVSVLFSLV